MCVATVGASGASGLNQHYTPGQCATYTMTGAVIPNGVLPITIQWSDCSGVVKHMVIPTGTTNYPTCGICVNAYLSSTLSAFNAFSAFVSGGAGCNITPPTITTTSLPDVVQNQAQSLPIVATGTAPEFRLASGTLPTGLSLNGTTGYLTGTPTTIGSYAFIISANNTAGTDNKAYTMEVCEPVVITTTTVANQTTGIAMAVQLIANTDDPLVWSLVSGSLPPGITLTEEGELVGTPTNAGTYNFVVMAESDCTSDTQSLSVIVSSPTSSSSSSSSSTTTTNPSTSSSTTTTPSTSSSSTSSSTSSSSSSSSTSQTTSSSTSAMSTTSSSSTSSSTSGLPASAVPSIDAPIYANYRNLVVAGCAGGTAQFYLGGVALGSPVTINAQGFGLLMGVELEAGDVITAKQTCAGHSISPATAGVTVLAFSSTCTSTPPCLSITDCFVDISGQPYDVFKLYFNGNSLISTITADQYGNATVTVNHTTGYYDATATSTSLSESPRSCRLAVVANYCPTNLYP